MRVSIYQTVEVSDEQRKAMAEVTGRKAITRDQMKDFIWSVGEDWALHLDSPAAVAEAEAEAAEEESLI